MQSYSEELIREIWGAQTVDYFYDANGEVYAMLNNGSMYYYVKNLQGDVMKMVDASGNVVASYSYDAWGKGVSASGTMAGLNSIRYRSYYYDGETGLYYLVSRYYSTSLGRFISPDGYVSTGQGFVGNNMYAYCGNNPVNGRDPNGMWTMGISISGSAAAILGISGSIGFFWDDKGNIEWQYSYSVPFVNNTMSFGLLGAGFGLTYQFTELETIYDLYGPSITTGFTAGSPWYVGMDAITFGDITEIGEQTKGFQFDFGYGIGVDAHIVKTNTSSFGEPHNENSDFTKKFKGTPEWHNPVVDPELDRLIRNLP